MPSKGSSFFWSKLPISLYSHEEYNESSFAFTLEKARLAAVLLERVRKTTPNARCVFALNNRRISSVIFRRLLVSSVCRRLHSRKLSIFFPNASILIKFALPYWYRPLELVDDEVTCIWSTIRRARSKTAVSVRKYAAEQCR
jgi:hypothetical protein